MQDKAVVGYNSIYVTESGIQIWRVVTTQTWLPLLAPLPKQAVLNLCQTSFLCVIASCYDDSCFDYKGGFIPSHHCIWVLCTELPTHRFNCITIFNSWPQQTNHDGFGQGKILHFGNVLSSTASKNEIERMCTRRLDSDSLFPENQPIIDAI